MVKSDYHMIGTLILEGSTLSGLKLCASGRRSSMGIYKDKESKEWVYKFEYMRKAYGAR
jgi:hypothetical protein